MFNNKWNTNFLICTWNVIVLIFLSSTVLTFIYLFFFIESNINISSLDYLTFYTITLTDLVEIERIFIFLEEVLILFHCFLVLIIFNMHMRINKDFKNRLNLFLKFSQNGGLVCSFWPPFEKSNYLDNYFEFCSFFIFFFIIILCCLIFFLYAALNFYYILNNKSTFKINFKVWANQGTLVGVMLILFIYILLSINFKNGEICHFYNFILEYQNNFLKQAFELLYPTRELLIHWATRSGLQKGFLIFLKYSWLMPLVYFVGPIRTTSMSLAIRVALDAMGKTWVVYFSAAAWFVRLAYFYP